jgi:hypothetical protein
MRALMISLSCAFVMLLAVWAYHQNYQTQAALRDVRELRADIADLRERAGVLRAEWAWLNRPERLADLADLNIDRLGLLPLRPDHFGRIADVVFPVAPMPEIEIPAHILAELEAAR